MSGRRCKALRRLHLKLTGEAPARTVWKALGHCPSEWRRLKKAYLAGKRQGKEMTE